MSNVYACHNKPRPTDESKYIAQKGWGETFYDGFGSPCRASHYVEVKSAFGTTSCQYDKSAIDKGCDTCQWAKPKS